MSNVRAIYDGFVGHDGVPVRVRDGDEYDENHPLVVANPALFTDPPKRPRTLTGRSKTPKGEDAGD